MISDDTRMVRVRVWFGNHVVGNYAASTAAANGYSNAILDRFAGLTITVDDDLDGTEGRMPAERLWAILPP